MALQVWLPLNGNLNNHGADGSVYSVPYSGATFENGKIGRNLVINNNKSSSITCPALAGLTDFTVSLWYRLTPDKTFAAWADILSFGTSSGSFRLEVTSATTPTTKWYGIGLNSSGSSGYSPTTGIWYHDTIVVTSSTVSRYRNGALLGTITKETAGQTLTGSMALGDANMYCQIADVRVYDECLSQTQIKRLSKCLVSHYQLVGPGGCENLILTSDRVTSGSQANGITRTYESDGSIKIVSESGNGNYCSLGFAQSSDDNVGAKMAVGDSYVVSCDIKVEKGTAFPTLFINNGNGYKRLQGDITKINEWQRVYYKSTWAEPGTNYGNISIHLGFSGAVGTYYFKNFKLEKGTELTSWVPAPTDDIYALHGYKNSWGEDSSGYGYHGQVVGTPTYGAKSARYKGNIQMFGSYLNKISSPLNADSDAFTFTCWYYPTAHTTGALYNNRTGVGTGISVFHLNSGIRFDTSEASQFQAGALTLNKWQHIACVYDKNAGIKKVYIDGKLISSTTSIGNLDQVGSIASIGASSTNDAGGGNTVSGAVSDVRIYATALEEADILKLTQNGGYIDNANNCGTYDIIECTDNKLYMTDCAVYDKQWNSGLAQYNQTNCQTMMTDEGIRIYRPPNIVHDSSTMHNMWGGFRISPLLVDSNFLQKGHTYVLLLDVKGQTTQAAYGGWTNQMGWGGGGLNPTPTNIASKWIPAGFNSSDYVTFYYKWTIEDDVYKTCTSSYSSFVAGEVYPSYRDFCLNFNYDNTGELGTDIYVRNLRCYDITTSPDIKLEQKGTLTVSSLQENNQIARLHMSGEAGCNEYIEI
jgi:hypothetical protein